MIIVKPTGGLCNRLRVINSAIHYGKLNNGKRIYINWAKNNDINADYESLFIANDYLRLIKKSHILNYFTSRDIQPISSSVSDIKKNIVGLWASQYEYYDDFALEKFDYDSGVIKLNRNIVLNTCYPLYRYKPEINNFYLLKPVQYLQCKINSILSKNQDNIIYGMHIRRTDNANSINVSKTDLFIEKAERLIKSDSNLFIYLSTDDYSIQRNFIDLFGHRILILENKDFSRNTLKGIEDAVIDLFILSNSVKIYGSYYSSFSEVASWINDTPLEIIQ
jgi:hypothetical protein